jgi:hypothetical protein
VTVFVKTLDARSFKAVGPAKQPAQSAACKIKQTRNDLACFMPTPFMLNPVPAVTLLDSLEKEKRISKPGWEHEEPALSVLMNLDRAEIAKQDSPPGFCRNWGKRVADILERGLLAHC